MHGGRGGCLALVGLGSAGGAPVANEVGMGGGAGARRRLARTNNGHEFAKGQTLRRTVDRGVS